MLFLCLHCKGVFAMPFHVWPYSHGQVNTRAADMLEALLSCIVITVVWWDRAYVTVTSYGVCICLVLIVWYATVLCRPDACV